MVIRLRAAVFTAWPLLLLTCAGCPDPDPDDQCPAEVWYTDADGDGHGDDATATSACDQPAGTVPGGGDCDDNDVAIHPGADELCDALDNDCDNAVDEGLVTQAWYPDADGDGYGDTHDVTEACAPPDAAMITDGSDCDDNDVTIHPGADDPPCDGIDDNCDGTGAATVSITDDGSGTGTMAEFDDLQGAIDAAFATAPGGATVYICPGEHVVSATLAEYQAVTVTSYSGNADDTALSGDGKYRVLDAPCGSALTLTDLTVRHGRSRPPDDEGDWDVPGGAVRGLSATVVIERCTFEENWYERNYESESTAGGAIGVYDDPDDDCDDDAMLSVSDSLFRDNYARAGGALVCYRFTECSIAGTTFENNQTDSSCGLGGAIDVQGWGGDDLQQGQLAITGSTFRDNQANNGGAIVIEFSDASTALISDCTFDNNIAGDSGGGLDIYIAGELRIEDCEFLGQQVGFAGGAMDISGQGPTVEIGNCLFESNESVYNGVLSLSPDDSVITISESEFLSNPDRAIALSGDGNTLDLVETVFEDNYQALDVDAGMGNAPPSTVTMRGCTIFRSTSYGAALDSWGALVTLESIDSDWGDGADDNVGGDINILPFGVYTMPAPPASVTCTTMVGCS